MKNPSLAKRVRAVHLPYSHKGIRLNIADGDRRFRRRSIRLIVDTIRRAHVLSAVRRYIIHPIALETWDGQPRGLYSTAIDSMSEIMERSEPFLRGLVVLENNRVYYPSRGISPRTNRIFADNAEEWRDFAADVGHPLLALCLDTSHAVTSAHLYPRERRDACLREFLAAGPAIRHVHWSGNYPYDSRGRADSHAALGTAGTQRLWFHREIARLDATRTIEIPRLEALAASLRYLARHELVQL